MTASENSRMDWLDIARGIGILLVVIGHVGEGIIHSGMTYPGWMFGTVEVIYSFHMPLFFIISGFLFLPSFQRNSKEFIPSKIKNILYPYLLWTILQTLVEVFLSKYTNKGIGIDALYPVLWHPRAHFWYLHALFFISIFNYAAYKIHARYGLIFGFILYLFGRFSALDLGYWAIPVNNLLFFIIGILFWLYRHKILPYMHRLSGMAGITILFFLGEVVFLSYGSIHWLFFIGINIAGAIWVLSISSFPFPNWKVKILSSLGHDSLYIYLLHVLAGSGARIVADKLLGIEMAEFHFLLGIFFGIGFPLIMVWFFRRLGWMGLFSWKKSMV